MQRMRKQQSIADSCLGLVLVSEEQAPTAMERILRSSTIRLVGVSHDGGTK
jgi:hypothetical protein